MHFMKLLGIMTNIVISLLQEKKMFLMSAVKRFADTYTLNIAVSFTYTFKVIILYILFQQELYICI